VLPNDGAVPPSDGGASVDGPGDGGELGGHGLA
jgi:hypothetical protein